MLAVEIIGRIDAEWREWLGGLTMTHCEPNLTMLTGVLIDHVAVHRIINRLRDLGVPLTSGKVEAVEKEG